MLLETHCNVNFNSFPDLDNFYHLTEKTDIEAQIGLMILNVSALSKRLFWKQNSFWSRAWRLIFVSFDIGLIHLNDSCDFIVFFRAKRYFVFFRALLNEDLERNHCLGLFQVLTFFCRIRDVILIVRQPCLTASF